jgi:CRP-like cAMP-binding protein
VAGAALLVLGAILVRLRQNPTCPLWVLTQQNTRWTLSKYKVNQIVYSQGDPADSVFYIHTGKVKVTVNSKFGKEAIVAIRGPDEFCGEGALTGKSLRLRAASRANSRGRQARWSEPSRAVRLGPQQTSRQRVGGLQKTYVTDR